MIQQYGDIVTFMYIFAHSSILRRKRRGIYPKEIKMVLEEMKQASPNTEITDEMLQNELHKRNPRRKQRGILEES